MTSPPRWHQMYQRSLLELGVIGLTRTTLFPDGSQIHYHKLSDQDQKSYINEFPKLYMGNDNYLTRKSYYEVVDHSQNHEIFIIPYLMLWVDAPPQGFTVGKEDTDDVPAMLESALGYMNNMCYKGLMKTNSTLSIPERNHMPSFPTMPRAIIQTLYQTLDPLSNIRHLKRKTKELKNSSSVFFGSSSTDGIHHWF